MLSLALALPTLLAIVSPVQGQWDGWVDGQVNTTLCQWQDLRGIILRDTIYLDGGRTYWLPGMNDGTYGSVNLNDNQLGYMFTISLNSSIDLTTANFTDILGTISKARGGSGNAASNGAPNYMSGALIGNSAEYYLYGGLAANTSAYELPDANDVLLYQRYEYGAERDFSISLDSFTLDSGTDRYVTYGAGATVNSEWKAFYFSGLRSESGPIYQQTSREETPTSWTHSADFLITLETEESNQLTQKWTNTSLPDNVKGRAAGEFVFVPVGSNGVMVAVGGVTYPEFVNGSADSANPELSESEGKRFHETIDIYDIGSQKWYQQNTTLVDTPPTLSRGCAVMAEAPDRSSYNIYYYGGYTAISGLESYSDDVWVLSLPSFTWTKIYSGNNRHGRVSHQCFQPYPGQMMIIGGMTAITSASTSDFTCLEGNAIQLFNMSSLEWLDVYDPAVYSNYTVPDAISNVIGGDASGSATETSPAAGWNDEELEALFGTAYPTSRIVNYYPYAVASVSNTTNSSPGSFDSGSSSSGVSNGAIAAIVVCSLLAVSFIIGLLIWWRRRRMARMSEENTTVVFRRNRVLTWILGNTPTAASTSTPSAKAALTGTTDTFSISPGPFEGSMSPMSAMSVPAVVPVFHHEMEAAGLPELEDTSRPDLGGTGMTPIQVAERRAHRHSSTGQSPLTMSPTGLSDTDRNSFISQTDISSIRNSEVSPQAPSPSQSPTIPDDAATAKTRPHATARGLSEVSNLSDPAMTPSPVAARAVSGVSNLSENERRHLRQISDVTISNASDTSDAPVLFPVRAVFAPPAIEEHPEDGTTSSAAVSPPESPVGPSDTLGKSPLQENVTAKTPYTSSGRRSVFHESRDDLGEMEDPKPSAKEQGKK
ncbi:hypothetical protein BROUX41_005981 [Berkeleyomyces rouxiae]|uniref:uncharacterized protein n=1 Tax=Berkeleyomyces rouxiae TaxID=2035830 RepID=UPI003B762B69